MSNPEGRFEGIMVHRP